MAWSCVQTFVSPLAPFGEGFFDSCIPSMHTKTVRSGQAFVVRGPFLFVVERLVRFCDDGYEVYK